MNDVRHAIARRWPGMELPAGFAPLADEEPGISRAYRRERAAWAISRVARWAGVRSPVQVLDDGRPVYRRDWGREGFDAIPADRLGRLLRLAWELFPLPHSVTSVIEAAALRDEIVPPRRFEIGFAAGGLVGPYSERRADGAIVVLAPASTRHVDGKYPRPVHSASPVAIVRDGTVEFC